jgi:hypothetical protein
VQQAELRAAATSCDRRSDRLWRSSSRSGGLPARTANSPVSGEGERLRARPDAAAGQLLAEKVRKDVSEITFAGSTNARSPARQTHAA